MIGEDSRYVETTVREDLWRHKYQIALERFSTGMESEDVFRAVLFTLGFRGREIDTEVNLAKLNAV